MLKKSLFAFAFLLVLPAAGLAQRWPNTGDQPPRTQQPVGPPRPAPTPIIIGPAPGAAPAAARPAPARPRPNPRRVAAQQAAAAEAAVRAAFDTLVSGIQRADVATVMSVYWDSPQLVLFNNNGTVTKSWEQVRANRATSYPNLKDVKLDVRDVKVRALGADAALVTCLWTQTQTVKDQSERATGRLTLVFQKVGGAWKIVHTHTSPDRPSPSNLLPSERTPGADGTQVPPAKP